MKVLVVLGIVLLVATGAIPYREDQGYQNVSSSEINNTCPSLNKLVWNKTHVVIDAINRNEIGRRELTREMEIQILIQEFFKAAVKCIPNNRVYHNVHVSLDDLYSLIERFPSPKNVKKRIAEAQDYMDEHFDELHPARYKFPHHRQRIDEFIKDSSRRAAELFKFHRNRAEDASKIFRRIPLFHATRDIVSKVDDCLSIRGTDFESVFKCREGVRKIASRISDLIKDLHHTIKYKLIPSRYSIDTLLMNFTAEKREIEDLMKIEEMELEFINSHRH